MQATDCMKEQVDRIENKMHAAGGGFERLASGQTRMLWKHSGIPNAVLCVEQDTAAGVVEHDGNIQDILLVGEKSDPDNLYPFDDVCSCWAGGWHGVVPTTDPRRRDLETKCLPELIDRCVDASVAYATQQGEPAEGDDPPGPVLSLIESLALVEKFADEIKTLFSDQQIARTRRRLQQRRQEVYRKIGLDLGYASEQEETPLALAAQSVHPG